jgi:hypothetical protein
MEHHTRTVFNSERRSRKIDERKEHFLLLVVCFSFLHTELYDILSRFRNNFKKMRVYKCSRRVLMLIIAREKRRRIISSICINLN